MNERDEAVVRRLWQAMNEREVEAFDEIVSPTFRNHNPFSPPVSGPDNFRLALKGLTRGFPDVHYEVERVISRDGEVWAMIWMSGTHRGEFMGLQPNGRSFRSPHVWIYRLENGLIEESWAVMDDLGSMVQLGHVAPLTPGRVAEPAPAEHARA